MAEPEWNYLTIHKTIVELENEINELNEVIRQKDVKIELLENKILIYEGMKIKCSSKNKGA